MIGPAAQCSCQGSFKETSSEDPPGYIFTSPLFFRSRRFSRRCMNLYTSTQKRPSSYVAFVFVQHGYRNGKSQTVIIGGIATLLVVFNTSGEVGYGQCFLVNKSCVVETGAQFVRVALDINIVMLHEELQVILQGNFFCLGNRNGQAVWLRHGGIKRTYEREE